MLYTNGRILIDWKNNAEALAKATRTVENFLFEDRAMDATFVLDDSVPYPCYIIPQGVSYNDLDQALRPNISLRAINEDIITLTDRKEVTLKHYFNEDEKSELARVLTGQRVEMMKLEKRKATTMKEFNAQIGELDDKVLEGAMKYEAGHEERDYDCIVKLNFADGYKYYIDAKDGETIRKAEPIEGKDRQLRFDVSTAPVYNPEAANEHDEAPEPGGQRESFLTGSTEVEHEELPDSNETPEPGSDQNQDLLDAGSTFPI